MTNLEVLDFGLLDWRLVDVFCDIDSFLDNFEVAGVAAVPNACLHALHTWCAKHHSHKIPCSLTTFTVMTFTSDPLPVVHDVESFIVTLKPLTVL